MLVGAAAIACVVAGLWMSEQREAATIAATHLAAARRDMGYIVQVRLAPGQSVAESLDSPEISRRIREATRAAGLDDPSSIEPSPPARVAMTDYTETPVYLALEPLTLKQLVTFLHHLCRIDPGARIKQIELNPPDAAGGGAVAQDGPEDLWTAGVAVGYLTYSPRK
jgi:hypothetical protein